AREKGREVHFLALDSVRRELPAFPHVRNEKTPMFSPDGRWIAFVSDESGRDEVYVRPFATPGTTLRQISTVGGRDPRWTRGGQELVFRNGIRMMAAPFDLRTGEPGKAVELLVRAGWADAATTSYDVTPDGTRFLVTKPQFASATRDIVIVVNWTAELE